MQIIKTEAFVLKCFKYGETSKIVTLFTKDYGKISAIAKGVRNYKSRICGTMESMNYISAVIYMKENREIQLVSNAEYKRSFPGIVKDFDKIEIAFKIIEMVNRSVTENYINSRIFDLLIKVFSGLEKADKNYSNYALYFLMNLADILGLSPDFTNDYYEHETFFSLNEFYMTRSNFEKFYMFNKSTLEDIGSIESELAGLCRLIINYERFISNHTQGLTNFKSNKVFKELNTNI
ncbi:MAG TPA: DNA repair protein RecO [Ignavibacteria bacterium]|nr:DNA repair protein RecO [Ignavibacteria bacterium]HMR39208.1 DNA repair protein RecO [Ignavibacteria bacterium]